MDDFGATHGELAQRLGRSRSHITNTLRLLNLPPKVQTRVSARVLSAGHARALLALEDSDFQDRLAERIVHEGLSVRSLEEIIALQKSGHDVEGGTKARRASTSGHTPQAEEWANRLSDRFDTGQGRLRSEEGKLVVEFATMEDLKRIIAQMGEQAS